LVARVRAVRIFFVAGDRTPRKRGDRLYKGFLLLQQFADTDNLLIFCAAAA
jgi:hypothetical protein